MRQLSYNEKKHLSNTLWFLIFNADIPYLFGMVKKKKKMSVKDQLEMAEAICTIVVTLMALWGTISAFNHSLFSKMSHLIEHYHQEIMLKEENKS